MRITLHHRLGVCHDATSLQSVHGDMHGEQVGYSALSGGEYHAYHNTMRAARTAIQAKKAKQAGLVSIPRSMPRQTRRRLCVVFTESQMCSSEMCPHWYLRAVCGRKAQTIIST